MTIVKCNVKITVEYQWSDGNDKKFRDEMSKLDDEVYISETEVLYRDRSFL